MKTIPHGAATTVLAATAPEYAERGGRYLSDCREAKQMALALDAEVRSRLWERSAAFVTG